MRRARVLIADGLPIFRAGLQTLLARETDFKVMEVSDSDELAAAVGDCPDIALVDLELPPAGGVAAVARLSVLCSACRTVVWSFSPHRETILDAIRAGAAGYLEKTISPSGLVRALRGIERGEAPLSRDLATLMIDALHGHEERQRARERTGVLSGREREVLDLVARGARNKEVAAQLVISEFTVKRHMQNILDKLDVRSREAAAACYETAFARERAG